jgi:hypothetical protein
MRLKELAIAAMCTAALGGAAVSPAAAKDHKDMVKRCHNANQEAKFTCVTSDGDTVQTRCARGYSAMPASSGDAAYDYDYDGIVCYSAELGYADDLQ